MRKRSTGIAAIILLTALGLGCGSTFRPIATPIPEPGGDPNALRRAVVVNENGTARGSVSIINTAGDTNSGNVVTGVGPVHAGFVGSGRTYVANQGEDTVTRIFTASPGSTPGTIPVPAGCDPQFVTNRTGSVNAYVACPSLDEVAVLAAGQDAIVTTVAVGANPVAVSQPVGSKVYSLNAGAGTLSVIQAVDNTVSSTIAVGGSPVWWDTNPGGTLLFVANAAGYVSVIDTATDTVVTTPTGATIPVGAEPVFTQYDANRNRLYVMNHNSGGAGSVSVIDASASSPSYLTVIGTVPVGSDARSLTALRNGAKVYVANCGSDSVSVIDALSLAVSKTIPTGNCPISLASPTDSGRVVVGVRGAGAGEVEADPPAILSISTQTDTVVVTLKPPQRASTCVVDPATNPYCPLQQPIFVTMAP